MIELKPSTEIISNICRWISRNLYQDKDLVIVIDGFERSGKSSFAYWLGKEISRLTDNKFGINNYVWDGDLLVNLIYDMPERSTIILDEAGFDMYKRLSSSTTNVSINKALMICGQENQCIILVMPFIKDLDKFARDRRAQIWFRVNMDWYGDEIIRGVVDMYSNLYPPLFDTDAYWKYETTLIFADMPANFKSIYKPKKAEKSWEKVSGNDENNDKNGYKKSDAIQTYLKNKPEMKIKLSDRAACELFGWDRSHFKEVKKNLNSSE